MLMLTRKPLALPKSIVSVHIFIRVFAYLPTTFAVRYMFLTNSRAVFVRMVDNHFPLLICGAP